MVDLGFESRQRQVIFLFTKHPDSLQRPPSSLLLIRIVDPFHSCHVHDNLKVLNAYDPKQPRNTVISIESAVENVFS